MSNQDKRRKPANDNKITERQLIAAGFTKKAAFIPPDAYAEPNRQSRYREKQRNKGIAQLNVRVPANDDANQLIKDISTALLSGHTNPEVARACLFGDQEMARLIAGCHARLKKGGFLAWALKLFI